MSSGWQEAGPTNLGAGLCVVGRAERYGKSSSLVAVYGRSRGGERAENGIRWGERTGRLQGSQWVQFWPVCNSHGSHQQTETRGCLDWGLGVLMSRFVACGTHSLGRCLSCAGG